MNAVHLPRPLHPEGPAEENVRSTRRCVFRGSSSRLSRLKSSLTEPRRGIPVGLPATPVTPYGGPCGLASTTYISRLLPMLERKS
jgi:hypothetical protein